MAVQPGTPNPLVHKVEMSSENNTRKTKTKIDEIFEEREERAAKRFGAAELEKMAIESENDVARLRGDPPVYKYGGETMSEEAKTKEEEKQAEQRDKLVTSAKALIDSGLPPQQVGQMLIGLPSMGFPPANLGGGIPAVAGQGMGFEDVLKFVNLIVGKQETDDLKRVIANLDKKMDDFARGDGKKEETKPIDPVAFARQQAEAVTAWNKAIKELMPNSAPTGATGDSLEVVMEQNRHTEKMEEIKTDRDYKENLTDIVTNIPERIGRGIAGQFSDEESGGKNHDSSQQLEFLICEECGQKIQITPETGNSVICPQCRSVFERGTTAKTDESPSVIEL